MPSLRHIVVIVLILVFTATLLYLTLTGKDPEALDNPPVENIAKCPGDGTEFDVPPRLTFRAPVDYPQEALDQGMEGKVVVHICVDENGAVTEATVFSHTAPPVLVVAALKSARACRFEPGSKDGLPVKTSLMIPFGFKAQDEGDK